MGKGDSRPQQPELTRTGNTPLNPDSVAGDIAVRARIEAPAPERRLVPEDNRPGHHPPHEQDKPDVKAFGAKARGTTRPPIDDLREGRTGIRRAAITVAGLVGTAVGVTRALQPRR